MAVASGQNQLNAPYMATWVRDACYGDSGGPLMVAQNRTLTLAGVVSWGADGSLEPSKIKLAPFTSPCVCEQG